MVCSFMSTACAGECKVLLWLLISLPYPQSSLTGLVALDLYNCPVTAIANYRDQVLELLSSLNSLDGLNRAGEDVEDSEGEEEG